MFSIDIHGLRQLSCEQLQQEVEKLSAHIEAGKSLSHIEGKMNECSLLALDQQNAGPPADLKVLEDLNAVLLRSIEMGIDTSHKMQFDKISDLRDQIIANNPMKGDVEFFEETLGKILSKLSLREAEGLRTVEKKWNKMVPPAQIKSINQGRLALRQALVGMSAAQAVDWLIANPHCKSLKYADFTGLGDFDNTCLQKLTDNCPNLKHLLIPNCKISGDALKHLAHVPELASLNVTSCGQLEADALKHLAHVKKLASLNVAECEQLEADALKHLAHVPELASLDVTMCRQLEADALKHLAHVKKLASLNVVWCRGLNIDSIPTSLKLVIEGP